MKGTPSVRESASFIERSSPNPDPTGWRRALGDFAGDRVNQIVYTLTTLVVAFGYSVLLPFDYTQRVSFANWDYLNVRLLAFTVAFGLTIGLVVTLQVHAVRQVIRQRSGAVTGLAAAVSLLPSFLCCTPVVPTILGVFGASAATTYRTTGTVQYFFATQQNLLLGTSLGFVVLAGLWGFRRMARAGCLTGEGCTPVNTPTDSVREDR
jgi:hypothetical protein